MKAAQIVMEIVVPALVAAFLIWETWRLIEWWLRP